MSHDARAMTWLRALLAVLLLGALVPVAHADWARDYDLGVRAVQAGDWAEAERRMRAALSEAPEDAARKRFQGQRFDRYLPHWYAGLAAYRQGNCARAMEYWNDSTLKRVLPDFADLAAEQRNLGTECGTRLAAASPQPATPASGSVPPQAPAPVASQAQAPAPTRAQPDRSAPAKVAQTPPREPPRQPRAAEQAPARPAAQPPAAAPRSARVAAPPALRSAVEAWLAGRYDQLAGIAVPDGLDAKARAQLLLLRAAARYISAELAGTEDGLDAARTDLRAARAVGMPSLDTALFPPRFRQFATTTR